MTHPSNIQFLIWRYAKYAETQTKSRNSDISGVGRLIVTGQVDFSTARTQQRWKKVPGIRLFIGWDRKKSMSSIECGVRAMWPVLSLCIKVCDTKNAECKLEVAVSPGYHCRRCWCHHSAKHLNSALNTPCLAVSWLQGHLREGRAPDKWSYEM